MSKPKKQPEPQALQSIDPNQLKHVAGGAARASGSSGDSEVLAALTGITDALSSLKNQQSSSGFGPAEMMMFMMMMGGGGGGGQPQVVQAPANTIGGYAGYTIDGVYYPFK
jgi:hypothetical protein